jgi:O-antigen ligase
MTAEWFPVSRRVSLVVLFSLLGGVILSFSRTGWVALAVAAILMVFLIPGRTMKAFGLAGLVVAVVVGLVLAVSREQRDSFTNLLTRNTIDKRVEIAEAAIDDFGANPVVGIGLGEFKEREGDIIHTTGLWFLAEFGLVGFAVFGGLMFDVTRKAIGAVRRRGAERDLAIGLLLAHLSYFVLALGIEGFYQRPWWMVMAVIGVVAAAPDMDSAPETVV